MIWLVRTIVVCAFALDAPIVLAANRHSLAANVISGLLTGLVAVWLSSLLGKRLQATYPRGLKRIGVALYVIGTAVAAFSLACAAFAAYAGAGRELVVVTASMSIIYWTAGWGLYRSLVARETNLNTRRPGGTADIMFPQTDRAAFVPEASVSGNKRHRKIALSLAIVGALAAPFVSGAYNAWPLSGAPSTAQEKQEFANIQSHCQENDRRKRQRALIGLEDDRNDIFRKVMCDVSLGEYDASGEHKYHFDRPKYLLQNVGVAAATFIGVFVLAFLIPIFARGSAFIVRRYWQWLNT